jgi:PAS domain S-box-containing protein
MLRTDSRRDTPCNSAEHPCPLEIVKQTKRPVTVEHFHHGSSGEPVYLELHGYPIFDESGNIVQMIEHSHNITERKKAEIELKKLFMAVEQSLNIVMITDKDGVIEYVNPTFTEITGYTKDEVIGRKVSSFSNLDTEGGEKFRESLNKYDKWIGEYQNKRKDGTTYWEYASISSIRNENNEITNYIRDAIDITQRSSRKNSLKRQRKTPRKPTVPRAHFWLT